MAAIAAAQMLVAQLGEERAADRMEQAIIAALTSGKIKSVSAGRMGMSTSEMGDLVASLV
jgi:3-isopropylmalate dehydrogenase